MQRECPEGYTCSLGPYHVDGHDDQSAWLCTEMPDDDDDFMTELIDIILGMHNTVCYLEELLHYISQIYMSMFNSVTQSHLIIFSFRINIL